MTPPHAVVDILLETFTWIGLGGAFVLAVVVVIAWASDGTWLAADALVDHDGADPVVRWIDADGDVNSAVAVGEDAEALAGRDRAEIWYRLGWQGRMRLTRRPHGFRPLLLSAGGMLALGILAMVTSWVLYFVRG